MKKLKRNVDGITLIALVVTIVVLLILAGVSITAVFGDNGLIQIAKKATEETKKTSEEEQRQLTMAEATMNLNGTKYKSTYKGKEVNVPIPAGFAVSQVDGENTVEDGLVIIDSEGNEFVWIPVENVTTEYMRNTNYMNYDSAKVDEGYLPDELVNGQYSNEEEIEKQLIQESGGFYVGRYEAGVDGDISISYQERILLLMEWKSISNL